MFMLRSILLPVDFSERSIGAAQYARALACRFHSELHIVHVVDTTLYRTLGVGHDRSAVLEFAPGILKAAEHELDTFMIDKLRSLNVKRRLLFGDPSREIVKYADSENVSLIVLPTHGYGLFRRFLLGSVTAKVLHDANCPVWTRTHMDALPNTDSISFGRILCALDPSNRDYSALAWAWHFAREIGGEVKIVHALPTVCANDSPYFRPEIKEQILKHAEAEILKAQQSIGSQAEVEFVAEEVHRALCTVAKASDADLMVISRGAAAFDFLERLRSRSYAIIRESPCPVVSV